MFKAGDQIGPYAIVRHLGDGAMGEVYQGRHRHMGRDAAIKVLRAELTEDAEVVSRFFTEARATAAVRHPGIVEIFDCDIHRTGRAFIVMEYLRGEDLARRLERGAGMGGDLPAALAIARQIADALGAAHAAGIVHRDLKPGNIFLVGEASPIVKIVDFGIAKLLQSDGVRHDQTRTGHILGTPLYMSPEQARGARTIDERTDVYALGCVLFELVAGRPPFERSGPAEVIVAHLYEPAPRLASVAPGVPAPLDALVAAMLAKAPEERPATMSEVLAGLAHAAGSPAPSRVATQLLPEASAPGGRPTAEPAGAGTRVASAVAKPAAVARTKLLPSEETPPVSERRVPRVFARAASTTLGGSASEIAASADDVPPAAPRSRALAIGAAIMGAALGVIVLVGAIAWQRARSVSPAAEAAVAPASVLPSPLASAAPPAPPPSAPSAPAQVEIEIASEPPGAEVLMGDETAPRGRTPFKLKLATDAPPARAVLRAEGHDAATIVLDARDPRPIHVILSPSEARAPARAEPRHHAKTKRAFGDFKAIED